MFPLNGARPPRAEVTHRQRRFHDFAITPRNAIRATIGTRAHGLSETWALEVQRDAILRRVSPRRASQDHVAERIRPFGFTIVMRAGGTLEETKPVVQLLQPAIRVGETILKPAEHARADASQYGSRSPRFAQQFV